MRVYFFLTITVLAFFSACSSKITEPVTSPYDSTGRLHGDVHGYVALADTQKTWLVDRSGVQIRTLGKPYSTVSDAQGKWTIHLPEGTYDFEFSKAGYGPIRYYGFNYSGDGDGYLKPEDQWHPFALGEKPKFKLVIDSVSSSNMLTAYYHTTDSTSMRSAVMLVGRDSAFDPLSANTFIPQPNSVIGGPKVQQHVGGYDDLLSLGFQKGENLFVAVAPYNLMGNTSLYTDHSMNREVRTAFGPRSNVIRFVVK